RLHIAVGLACEEQPACGGQGPLVLFALTVLLPRNFVCTDVERGQGVGDRGAQWTGDRGADVLLALLERHWLVRQRQVLLQTADIDVASLGAVRRWAELRATARGWPQHYRDVPVWREDTAGQREVGDWLGALI